MDYRKIVEYIVDSCENGDFVNVIQASKKFDCSVSSIRKCIAKLKSSNNPDDINLYNKYFYVSRVNQEKGRVMGGKNGKRTSNFSRDEVSSLCNYIIENDCTLRQLEKESGIPKSTLYDNLDKLGDSRLSAVYSEHRRNSLNDYNNDIENNSSFNSVGSELSRRVTRKK